MKNLKLFISKETSWNSVNPTFIENYRPRECICSSEFWMTYQDFLGHFGDLVICSSPEPYECPSWEGERCYTASEANTRLDLSRSCSDLTHDANETKGCGLLNVPSLPGRKLSLGITVQESKSTVKIDTVEKSSRSVADISKLDKSRLQMRRLSARDEDLQLNRNNSLRLKSRASLIRDESNSNVPPIRHTPPSVVKQKVQGKVSRTGSIQSSQSEQSNHSLHSCLSGVTDPLVNDLDLTHGSIASNLSGISVGSISSSDHDSLYSTSEIKIKVSAYPTGPVIILGRNFKNNRFCQN